MSCFKTCNNCKANIGGRCYGIELVEGSEAELEKPLKADMKGYCRYFRFERPKQWNGRKL